MQLFQFADEKEKLKCVCLFVVLIIFLFMFFIKCFTILAKLPFVLHLRLKAVPYSSALYVLSMK